MTHYILCGNQIKPDKSIVPFEKLAELICSRDWVKMCLEND
jgi:hypothetical protein